MSNTHRQAWVTQLKPGELVASRVTGDIGSVLEREKLGVTIRWRVSVTEFVLFSQSDCLVRASWRKRVHVTRNPYDPECGAVEEARIRAEIEEARAARRPPPANPRALALVAPAPYLEDDELELAEVRLMRSAKKPPPMVVTITREEVNPRQMPQYKWTWKYVYRIANVQKPHRLLKHAIAEAKRRWPGCVIRCAWKVGAA